MGDIELQITMNSIMQQRMFNEFDAIKNRQNEELQENMDSNEAKLKKLAKDGRLKANGQSQQVNAIKAQLDDCIRDSNRAIDQLNEIILRPPLRIEQLDLSDDNDLMREAAKKLANEAEKLRMELKKSIDEIRVASKKLTNYQPGNEQYNAHISSTNEAHKDIINKVCFKYENYYDLILFVIK